MGVSVISRSIRRVFKRSVGVSDGVSEINMSMRWVFQRSVGV